MVSAVDTHIGQQTNLPVVVVLNGVCFHLPDSFLQVVGFCFYCLGVPAKQIEEQE